MAATIIINRLTGAGPTKTQITVSTRASTSDSDNPGTSDPVPIPTGADKYSYWVNTRLECTVTPSGTVDNLRWYTDGVALPTGVTMEAGHATAYTQATGTPGDTGTQLTDTNYTGGTLSPPTPGSNNAIASYLVGTPLAVTGSITNPTTGDFGNLVVYQYTVANTASPGTVPTTTITWKYDET